MNYEHISFLNTSTYNMRVNRAYANHHGHFLESVRSEWLSQYERQQCSLIFTHSLAPLHVLQSHGRRDALCFCSDMAGRF